MAARAVAGSDRSGPALPRGAGWRPRSRVQSDQFGSRDHSFGEPDEKTPHGLRMVRTHRRREGVPQGRPGGSAAIQDFSRVGGAGRSPPVWRNARFECGLPQSGKIGRFRGNCRYPLPQILLPRKMAVQASSRMNFVERTDQIFVGRIAFPAVNYLLNRRDILGRCRKLLVTEHLPQEAVRELQFERLSAALRHGSRWSPFYTRRFKEIGLAPGDIKTLEDVRRIPPLVRQDVVDHRRDMVDLRCREAVSAAEQASRAAGSPISFARFRRHKLIRRSSSGSTGTPTVVYEDGSTTSLNWVHELRLKHWFGLSPGAKEARMSVTSMEYAAKGKFSSAREWLWNQMTLPGYFLSEHEYELCLR